MRKSFEKIIACIATVLCLFTVFLLPETGCSNKLRTYSVEGTVRLDSVPLEGAIISFIVKEGSSGHTAYSRTNEKGMYRLQTHLGEPNAGTTPGEYVVTFSKCIPKRTGKKEVDAEGNIVDELDALETLPLVYTKEDTTPFSATVVNGKNTFDFNLKMVP